MRLLILLNVLVLGGCRGPERSDEVVYVYAAASLTDVMEVMADTFRTREGDRLQIVLNVAGSSLLARQIVLGAGADVFVSAHPIWTQYLVDSGRADRSIPMPVRNRLVIVSRTPSWAFDGLARIAIADPDHVPAGVYAREALVCEGRWDGLRDRIVPTLDVRAALTAVVEGAASAALVYASDARLVPELPVVDAFDPRCSPDVRYSAVVVAPEKLNARRFLDLLRDPAMEPVWKRYGFQYEAE